MKKPILYILGASLLSTMTGCNLRTFDFSSNWSNADLKAATNVVQTVGISTGVTRLEVDNRFGAIHVTGTDNGDTSWTWKLAVRARNDSIAQQIASSASCKAELDGNQLKLLVSLPDTKEPHSIQSDFEIRVPKSVVIHAQNRFGKTDITDLAGDVEAANENGNLEIRNVRGSVRARTSFSTLTVSNTGRAILNNQNGTIRAAGIGGALEATTSFAPLTVQDIAGPASLANQNGKIEATGIGGPLDAKTSFAPLFARNVAGTVHLRDQNGSIKVVQAEGNADIQTSFASLNVEGIQGDAILMNQNGSVFASGITGSVKASTSFAALELSGNSSKFECQNQNGPIRLCATSTALRNIEAKTSFAPLEVKLPDGLKPAISAHTTFAEVESDFPVQLSQQSETPLVDTAQITLLNQNGKIRVLHN